MSSQSFLNSIKETVSSLSTLRKLLVLFSLFIMLFPADPDMEISLSGWEGVATMVLVFVPISFFVLLLDAMMARVVMSEYQGSMRRKYRRVVVIDLLLAGGIVVAWYSYFSQLMSSV